MQGLFEKLNSLKSSPSYSNTNVAQILSVMYDNAKRNSQQLASLTATVHHSKQETLTALGGKVSLSDFPTILEKYQPKLHQQLSMLKQRLGELELRIESHRQFSSLFDSGGLKQYQLRSLEDMIMGSQQYIKNTINELIITKVDRVELQRLYALNDRFDMELTNISKGLIELARNPYPVNQSREKRESSILQKLERWEERTRKQQRQNDSKYQELSKQISQQRLKLHQLQQSVPLIESRLSQSISSFHYQSQQFQQTLQQKLLTSFHNSNQSTQINILKEQLIELTQEINRLKGAHLTFDKRELVKIIDRHLQQIRNQPTDPTDRYPQQLSIVKQQVLRTAKRLQAQTKQRKEGLNRQIGALKRQLESKISFREMQRIIDKFSTFQETRQLISQHLKRFQEASFNGIRQFIDDQIVINQALCSQNVIARWSWEGDELRNGNLVPWQKQIINTSPQTYVWEENTHQILVLSQGIYRIELGVYSQDKKKPTIQIILNGHSVMSAVNNSSYVIHHSSGRLKQSSNPGKNSGVSGVTLVDFWLIPAKSRLAVSCVGSGSRGFLSLKKL